VTMDWCVDHHWACGRDPFRCPCALEENDGETLDGHPIRLWYPGPECPYGNWTTGAHPPPFPEPGCVPKIRVRPVALKGYPR